MRNLLPIALLLALTACSDSGTSLPAAETSGTELATEFGAPNDTQIRPGVLISAAGSQCTSNFIYRDRQGRFLIGAAAHCFSPDTNSGVDACATRNEPLGTEVVIENAAFTGTLAYSSWQAMQDQGETPGSEICQHNDFALVRIDPRDTDNVHPAARVFGGPTGLLRRDAVPGDAVFTYGQSPLHLGLATLQEKSGTVTGQSGPAGWSYSVSTDNPGLSGDSGSAVLHESGQALGALTTVGVAVSIPPAVSNGVVNLSLALAYANATAVNGISLVTWPEFTP